MSATGRFAWHELRTSDVEAAKRFYGDLFGWTYEIFQPGTMDYPMISAAGLMWGGMVTLETGSPAPPHWVGYITVDDVDAATGRARDAGGSVHVGPTQIPDAGRFAVVADPSGAVFAFHQAPGEAPAPPDRAPTGGFCWDELLTTDVDGALAFYARVVGWEDAPMDMGDGGVYHMLQVGGEQAGGLMAMPPGVHAPPHWVAYVAVENADATVAHAQKLGGRAYTDVIEVPGVGRFATLADPQGAAFAILQPAG